jgi:hypothetical protein
MPESHSKRKIAALAKKHPREDVSQAAAPVVREATDKI